MSSQPLLKRHASKATYQDTKFVTEKLVITFHRADRVVLDRFPASGSAILDLAKSHIWGTYYFKIKPHLGKDSRIIFGDTVSNYFKKINIDRLEKNFNCFKFCFQDSLYIMYKSNAKTNDELMKKLDEIMDTSNYPEDHFLHRKDRKSKPGKINHKSILNLKH